MGGSREQKEEVRLVCWVIRRADLVSRAAHHALAFYQVLDVEESASPAPHPPYIVAPRNLATDAASCAVAFRVTMGCDVVDVAALPDTADYGRPKYMHETTAAMLGLSKPSQALPCKGIQSSVRRTGAAAAPMAQRFYARRAGPVRPPPLNERDSDADEEEEDEEEEDVECPLDDTDESHMGWRHRAHPPSLFSPANAPQCYTLEQRLRLTATYGGVRLPLRAERVEEVSSPRQSPPWRVYRVHDARIASHLDLAGPNGPAAPGDGLPMRTLTTISFSAIGYASSSHKDAPKLTASLVKMAALKQPRDSLTRDGLIRLSAALVGPAGRRLFKVQSKAKAVRSIVAEAAMTTRRLVLGPDFTALSMFHPTTVLEMLSVRQQQVLIDAMQRSPLRAVCPTELAAMYCDVAYFRPLLLQRLAYARAEDAVDAHTDDADEAAYRVTACRALANDAWYGSGATLSLPEKRQPSLGNTLREAEAHLAAVSRECWALPSSAFYCERIARLLGAGGVELVTYRNATACVQRIANWMKRPASARPIEALRSSPILLLAHSYSAAAEARTLLGASAGKIAVMPYTALVAMSCRDDRRAAAARMGSAIMLRADILGESELHAVLDAFAEEGEARLRCPVALFHNETVQRPRRFFGSGAPLYHLQEERALPCVDWAMDTLRPSGPRLQAAIAMCALYASKSQAAALGRGLVTSKVISEDIETLRLFIKDNGRAVQLFTVGCRRHLAGEDAARQVGVMGHAEAKAPLLAGLAAWCSLYAPSDCMIHKNRAGELIVGQRVFLADVGQLAYVEAVGCDDPTGATDMIECSNQALPVNGHNSGTRVRLEASTAASIHAEPAARGGYNCCASSNGTVIAPLHHHTVDGTCIAAEDYTGPSVDAAVLFCGTTNLTHRAIASIVSLVNGPLLIVPLEKNTVNIVRAIVTRPCTGAMPPSIIMDMLGEGPDDSAPFDLLAAACEGEDVDALLDELLPE